MKQMIQVEVDIPSEFEVVSAKRDPTQALNVWTGSSKEENKLVIGVEVICRSKWQPPEWLNPGWIAMDSDNVWYWYEFKPVQRYSYWDTEGHLVRLSGIKAIKFVPPDCDDWKSSLREIKAKSGSVEVFPPTV